MIDFSNFEKLDWKYIKNKVSCATRGLRAKAPVIDEYADIGDIDFSIPLDLKEVIES